MSREILFRGKLIGNGEWVYGQYAYLLNARTEDGEPIKHMIVDGTPFGQTVDLATVGQYTGLIDKNGVKIFEGDVMGFDAYGFHYKGVVSFVDGNFCVICNHPDASPFLDDVIKRHDAVCVVNIHDNPELMEENEMAEMTLQEAIDHAREVANGLHPNIDGCSECAKQHGQLADWLEELLAFKHVAETPADVRPVVRSHWKRNDNGTYSCERCHSWIPEEQRHYANWCLYCGADMRGCDAE